MEVDLVQVSQEDNPPVAFFFLRPVRTVILLPALELVKGLLLPKEIGTNQCQSSQDQQELYLPHPMYILIESPLHLP